MDRISMLGPDMNSIKAVGALMDWIADWLFGDEPERAVVASGYAAAEKPTALTAAGNAPISITARGSAKPCSPSQIPPEGIETRYGTYNYSPWSCEWTGASAAVRTPSTYEAPQKPECRQATMPLETIEYRYSSQAREMMFLPICMNK